jgi:hypothetical protein
MGDLSDSHALEPIMIGWAALALVLHGPPLGQKLHQRHAGKQICKLRMLSSTFWISNVNL